MPLRPEPRMTRVLLLFLILFAGASLASAQGVIVPGQCRRCPTPPIREIPPAALPRSLPVKSIKIDTRISSQVATTHVEQVFRNDTNFTLEGTYFFPIPEAASISEFAIWEGNQRLVGEVRTREEARRIYDEIVRRQRDPGLLEYAGKDLFQASIFPILPHSDKKLEITYTQVVRAEGGTVSYRYPLGTGRQATQIGTVAGRVEVESREPLRNENLRPDPARAHAGLAPNARARADDLPPAPFSAKRSPPRTKSHSQRNNRLFPENEKQFLRELVQLPARAETGLSSRRPRWRGLRDQRDRKSTLERTDSPAPCNSQ